MYIIATISIFINIMLILFITWPRKKVKETKTNEPYRGKRISFTSVGLIYPGQGTIHNVFRTNFPFRVVKCVVNTPPQGEAIVLDINKNGTTIFSDQSNRPKINSGEVTTILELNDTMIFGPGDRITVDIDQVGSIYPGSDLLVFLEEE